MVIKYDFLKLTNNLDDLISNTNTNYKPEGAYVDEIRVTNQMA